MKRIERASLLKSSFVRFIAVGISNTIISYVVFFIAYHKLFLENTIISQSLSYSIGLVWSFIWNRHWTFKSSKHPAIEFLFFLLSQLTVLALSVALLYWAIDIKHHQADISWFIIMGGLTIVNYLVSRYWVFK